ncbi:SsgA family sporulation/cell division regulator [Nonomuraea terrae]|uniref:SsgA family sporulation/cell division regulator n=1 Tax=Nonomuraea terrae TaxID=2530383 RepID=UPI0014047450|nr:SsgA family sporulation/cell division regulator [Nonomuraea terrae]
MKTNFVHRPAILWVADRHDEQPYAASLVYRLSDPFAVELVLPRGDGRHVTKVLFGRALLIDGLEKPTGDGAVRIEPHIVDSDYITLTLPLNGRRQELYAERVKLEAFIDATFRLVPLGREKDLIDLDGWLLEVTS